MNQLLLNKFQDNVVANYSNYKLNPISISSDLCCTVRTLQRTIISYYGYSIMEYVEYFRILKSIEFTYYYGEKKVCYKVGYKYHSGFCRSFLRITQLHLSFFSSDQFEENKKVAREVRKLAKENPKEALELILNDFAERYTFKNGKMTKKSIKMTKKSTKKFNM